VKRRHAAALALLSFLLAVAVRSEAAVSGVIIEKKYTQGGADVGVRGVPKHCAEIEIIQGHKERSGSMVPEDLVSVPSECRGHWSVVDDLDENIETTIDYRDRSYRQKTFIEKNVSQQGYGIFKVKPTGKHRKIAEYSCAVYKGSGGTVKWGPSTGTECVSHEAPGAAEYSEFSTLLVRMNLGAGYDDFYDPKVVVLQRLLETDSTDPEEWVVTKIQSMPIPAKFFEPPAGFVKK
jgi:hypothetical protein